jgi:hypothetical protein
MITIFKLPWSTANEDLVELFETTGQVELAEILFEGTRSKGCGVVQFSQIPEAETAIGMDQFLFLLDTDFILIVSQRNSKDICMEDVLWVRWLLSEFGSATHSVVFRCSIQ